MNEPQLVYDYLLEGVRVMLVGALVTTVSLIAYACYRQYRR